MADPISNRYWLIPYRDFATREATIASAQANVTTAFLAQSNGSVPRVREGYWYDLQLAGATPYSGSNSLTFGASSNKYGFPAAVVLPITVPQSKVFSLYGIDDYAASPVLQAMQISQDNVNFPLIYLAPEIYRAPDLSAILNGSLPAVKQNLEMTITLYATATGTDPVDIKFELAENAAKTS